LRDPISKVPDTKRAGGVAQAVGPEFKPWYCKKKKKREREREGRGDYGTKNKDRTVTLPSSAVDLEDHISSFLYLSPKQIYRSQYSLSKLLSLAEP
jgi:hypothetical protein